MKREVRILREMMEERRRESGRRNRPSCSPAYARTATQLSRKSQEEGLIWKKKMRTEKQVIIIVMVILSISTVVPHELERVEEEDEDQLA